MLHIEGSVLSMFYRQGFSSIDGIELLDHRSLVQLLLDHRSLVQCDGLQTGFFHAVLLLMLHHCSISTILGDIVIA